MLTETLLRIPFFCDGIFSSADLSLAAWKMCKNSGMVLQNHRWLPVGIFSVKNCRFMFIEAGYWKAFQNLGIISKEQAKTLSFIFIKKLQKLSAHVQKVPIN
jgi:hypothetical protein